MTLRGLCIGINDYPGTQMDLKGCVNDAQDWKVALDRRGFTTELMLDGDASKKNMCDAMTRLVTDTGPDDVGVITYSGHGSWVVDEDRDEKDMRDEALCPHDTAEGEDHLIIDDELFEIFSQRQRGARVVLISDSCHSGSVVKMAIANAKADTTDRVRFLPPETFLTDDRKAAAEVAANASILSTSRTSALLMGGCQDLEYSYDATFGGRPNGAFTYVALEALGQLGTTATYTEWYKAIRGQLPNANHPQTPSLQGTSHQRRWEVLA
jgi:hypothetical protein